MVDYNPRDVIDSKAISSHAVQTELGKTPTSKLGGNREADIVEWVSVDDIEGGIYSATKPTKLTCVKTEILIDYWFFFKTNKLTWVVII